jgi:hypothetical protein
MKRLQASEKPAGSWIYNPTWAGNRAQRLCTRGVTVGVSGATDSRWRAVCGPKWGNRLAQPEDRPLPAGDLCGGDRYPRATASKRGVELS